MEMEKLILNLRNNWRQMIQKDEWYLSNFIHTHLDSANNIEAFDYINCVAKQIVQENDEFFLKELIDILKYLVFKANTTEMPNELRKNYKLIKFVINKNEYCKSVWDEIERFYLVM